MLQSVLFFVLGFLCSAFLALMVAPAIWRRAVVLTRKRIEAAVPLSVAEIQADKDRMRGELAMTIRRLEMNVQSLREKSAAQAIEISRAREEMKRLAVKGDERERSGSIFGDMEGDLASGPRRHEEQLQELAGKLADAERALKASTLELERVSKLYDEASFAASSRQIELVARESQVETLSGELDELRSALEQAERRQREMASEDRRGLLLQEDQRAGEPQRKVERLTTCQPDGEAVLRQSGVQQVRPFDSPHGGAVPDGFSARQDEAETAVSPETPVAPSRPFGEDLDAAVSKLSAARDILQERLTATGRQNRGASDLAAAPARSGDAGQDDTLLREQMADLAAEMIRLTVQQDGPDSPVVKALSAPAAPVEAGVAAAKVTSLADRVQALHRTRAAAAE